MTALSRSEQDLCEQDLCTIYGDPNFVRDSFFMRIHFSIYYASNLIILPCRLISDSQIRLDLVVLVVAWLIVWVTLFTKLKLWAVDYNGAMEWLQIWGFTYNSTTAIYDSADRLEAVKWTENSEFCWSGNYSINYHTFLFVTF